MNIVDRIYEAFVWDEADTLLPTVLADSVRARSCVMQRFDADGVLQDISHSYFSDEMVRFYGGNEIYRADLWSGILIDRSLLGHAVPVGKIVTEARFRSSVICNEFFRRFGDDTGRCIGVGFREADGGMSVVGLHRPFGDNEFTERSLRALDEVTPHLNRLGALKARLREAGQAADIARAGFDAIDQAAILADEFARPIIANRAAEQIFAENDGLAFIGGRLVVADTQAHQKLTRAIYDAARRRCDRGGACLLERPSGKRALRAIVAPLALGHRSCALILIDDPERNPPDQATDIAWLYGLTATETQIALAVGQGHAPEEIAEQRGVSIATIRTQIQSVFRKTDTHRTAELAMLLARLPRRSGG